MSEPRVVVCKKLTEIPKGLSLWLYHAPTGLEYAIRMHERGGRKVPAEVYQFGNLFYFPALEEKRG